MTEGSPSISKLLPWVVAVAAVLCAAWFGIRLSVTSAENAQLADQRALADVALKSVQAQLDAERVISSRLAVEYKAVQNGRAAPGVDPSRLTVTFLKPTPTTAPGALAVVVWDATRQEGVFVANHLPAPPTGTQYELWLSDGEPVNAGAFTVSADGTIRQAFKPAMSVKAGAKFMVTRESAGTVPTTPGEAVLMQ